MRVYKVCEGVQTCMRVCESVQMCMKVCEGMQTCMRVCDGECKHLAFFSHLQIVSAEMFGLMYNSEYLVWVAYDKGDESYVTSRDKLLTPGCHNPHRAFTECLPPGHKDSLSTLGIYLLHHKLIWLAL